MNELTMKAMNKQVRIKVMLSLNQVFNLSLKYVRKIQLRNPVPLLRKM